VLVSRRRTTSVGRLLVSAAGSRELVPLRATSPGSKVPVSGDTGHERGRADGRCWPARRRDPRICRRVTTAPGAHLAASVIMGYPATVTARRICAFTMREGIMYAVPHTVTITDPSAASAGLDQVVPQVSGLPGFVAGYWMARSADQGLAVVVFDSE
jgi:hypothetical protein